MTRVTVSFLSLYPDMAAGSIPSDPYPNASFNCSASCDNAWTQTRSIVSSLFSNGEILSFLHASYQHLLSTFFKSGILLQCLRFVPFRGTQCRDIPVFFVA